MWLWRKFQLWRSTRQMVKAWRKMTGGTARVRFTFGGGELAFSVDEDALLNGRAVEILRGVADMLEAYEQGKGRDVGTL